MDLTNLSRKSLILQTALLQSNKANVLESYETAITSYLEKRGEEENDYRDYERVLDRLAKSQGTR